MAEPPIVKARQSEPLSWRRVVVEAFRSWWAVTTDVQYLSSPGSRRWSWRWSLTLAAVFGFAIVWVYDAPRSVIAVDLAVILVLGYANGNLATHTLYSDMMVSVVFVVVGSFQLLMWPALQVRYIATAVPLATLILHTIGVHSIFVATSGIGTSCVTATLLWSDPVAALAVPAITIVTILFSAILEFNTACLVEKYQKQVVVTQRLLDTATNGFCSMDSLSGTIIEASPQLLHTLGSGNLVGLRLSDFAGSQDDCSKLDQLCSSTTLHDSISKGITTATADIGRGPILVTFHGKAIAPMGAHQSSVSSASGSFDAKVLLYAEAGGVVSACVQIIGEIRHITPDSDLGTLPGVHPRTSPRSDPGMPSAVFPRRAPGAGPRDLLAGSSNAPSEAIADSLLDGLSSCRDGVTARSQASKLSAPNSVLEASRRLGLPVGLFTQDLGRTEAYGDYGARVEDHMRLLRTVSDQHLEIKVAHLQNAQKLETWRAQNEPVAQLVLLRRGQPPDGCDAGIWTRGILPFLATMARPIPEPEFRHLPTGTELLQWARRIAWAEAELYADDIAAEIEELYEQNDSAVEFGELRL